jgi:hypothetical protein
MPAGSTAVSMRGAQPVRRLSPAEYNYEHFRTRHLIEEAQRLRACSGIRPGEFAPDFELPRAGSGTLRLSELRGVPVLLHFGSYT